MAAGDKCSACETGILGAHAHRGTRCASCSQLHRKAIMKAWRKANRPYLRAYHYMWRKDRARATALTHPRKSE